MKAANLILNAQRYISVGMKILALFALGSVCLPTFAGEHKFNLAQFNGMRFKLGTKANSSQACIHNLSGGDGDGYLQVLYTGAQGDLQEPDAPYLTLRNNVDHYVVFKKIDMEFSGTEGSLLTSDEAGCPMGPAQGTRMNSGICSARRTMPMNMIAGSRPQGSGKWRTNSVVEAKDGESLQVVEATLYMPGSGSQQNRRLSFDGKTLVYSETTKSAVDPKPRVIQECTYELVQPE